MQIKEMHRNNSSDSGIISITQTVFVQKPMGTLADNPSSVMLLHVTVVSHSVVGNRINVIGRTSPGGAIGTGLNTKQRHFWII